MVPEIEKPRVTEIKVRMDCNGCVQKIKKALHGIIGIYDLYLDFPQQKLTIIGWADPEKILKAIRNARRIATICNHTEPTEQQQAPETGAPQAPPAPTSESNPPPPKAPQVEAAPSTEPPKDPPPPPPPPPRPENPPPQEKPLPSPIAVETNASQPGPAQAPGPKDVGEVHVIYHHPPVYSYRYGNGHPSSGPWNRYHNDPAIPAEPSQPVYVTHSYNTYRPTPYAIWYEYISSRPQPFCYGRMDYHNDEYRENRNGNITTMFSDENPNACTIV